MPPFSTITNLCLFQFVVCAGVLMTFNPSFHPSVQDPYIFLTPPRKVDLQVPFFRGMNKKA